MSDSGNKNISLFTTIAGLALAAVLALADLSIGDMHISIFSPGGTGAAVLLRLRVPRVITAILAGASLALSGLQMQSIFRNPLTDPHIMGISSGASLGAAIAIIASAGAATAVTTASTVIAALSGAAASAAVVIGVSRKVNSSSTLLIFGVMLGFIFSAATSVLAFSASEHSLKMFYNWSSGSFSANTFTGTACMGAALLIGTATAAWNSRGLDIILFGDEYATLCGADARRIRARAMAGCCLMTGIATAFCGPLGFVGIVSPHIARWITGTSVHRRIIPAAIVTGIAISLCADIITQLSHAAVPVGSAMALIGIPVILFILFKSKDA